MRSRGLLILAAMTLTMGACAGSGEPADSTGTTGSQEVTVARAQVLDDLGRMVIVPGYLRLADSTAVLANDLEAACASETSDMDQLRQSWLTSLNDWLTIQSYRFGPLQDLDLSASIFYPIDPDKVDANAVAGVGDLTAIGSDAKGLGAIGHVLYASDQLGQTACPYLVSMAVRVADAARTVSDAWGEHVGQGLSATFPSTQAGIEMVVNDAIASVAEAASYLGDPPDEVAPEHSEGRDFEEIEARMLGVREVYQGAGGAGLSRLVQLAFVPTDERMNERLDIALGFLSAASSDPTGEEYLAAYDLVAAVHRTFTTEIASQLGATLMFGDSDGDS